MSDVVISLTNQTAYSVPRDYDNLHGVVSPKSVFRLWFETTSARSDVFFRFDIPVAENTVTD